MPMQLSGNVLDCQWPVHQKRYNRFSYGGRHCSSSNRKSCLRRNETLRRLTRASFLILSTHSWLGRNLKKYGWESYGALSDDTGTDNTNTTGSVSEHQEDEVDELEHSGQ